MLKNSKRVLCTRYVLPEPITVKVGEYLTVGTIGGKVVSVNKTKGESNNVVR